jgi:signal transduction histidine kinase
VRIFARLDEVDSKKANIHEGIESTLTLLAHELRGRATVVREFGQVPEIECYPNALNQVFVNMIVNAVQAIERDDGSGQIRIRTWEEDGAVRIAITDNGKGISPEARARIFEAGFTTKRAGIGTGLGLSICQKIVQKHGGRIEVATEVGQGSTFTIVLPIEEARERKSNA